LVKRYLLDTNVLIALLWPRHTHQKKAQAWFRAKALRSFATSSFTQAGFLRVSCSLHIVGHEFRLQEARELLQSLIGLPGHSFWPATIDFFEATAPFERRMHGPKQITDAYLLGLAKLHRGKIATFDHALLSLAGPEFIHLVELISQS
jgi:uncharacterized protein